MSQEICPPAISFTPTIHFMSLYHQAIGLICVLFAPKTYGQVFLGDELGDAVSKIVVAGTGGLGPADFATTPGVTVNGINHDGVGDMITSTPAGGFRSSASLLSSGRHILTAAHSVTNQAAAIDVLSGSIRFDASGGSFSYSFAPGNISVHPLWTGDLFNGFDVAVIDLGIEVDLSVPRYEIFTGWTGDLVNARHTKIGFGQSGTGPTGSTTASGTKRYGENHYEFTYGNGFGNILLFDFDNGLAENDAFGTFEPTRVDPVVTLGLGDAEGNSAPGDSGGPTFFQLDQQDPESFVIAGVTSFGTSVSTDVDGVTNSSFGEISGDTNVTSVASFISESTAAPIPEPSSWGMTLGFLVLTACWKRRKHGS